MSRYNTINFENHKIIIIIDNNNNIWFNAKQICVSLKYKEAKRAITNNVEKIDKIQLKNMNIGFTIKQQPDSIYINESGLYSLLISSKNKKSKKFIKWITNDVLPKLREQNIFSPDKEITKLLKKINELETKNKIEFITCGNKTIFDGDEISIDKLDKSDALNILILLEDIPIGIPVFVK